MPPDSINQSSLWGPIFALLVFGVPIIAAGVVQLIVRFFIQTRIKTTPNALGFQIVSAVKGPIVVFLVVLGLFLGLLVLTRLDSPAFDALNGWDHWVRNAWIVILILQASYFASNLSNILLGWYVHKIASRTTSALDDKLLPPIRRILPIVTYSIGILIALASLNIAISPLLAGFGIGGLAVALAVQPTLSNFFSGTYLVTEGELKEGDYIELEGGPAGYVVDVGWRSTKIRSRYNNLVMIPNSRMVDSIVTNYFSPTPALNVIVNCGVSYESDLSHVEKTVLNVTRAVIKNSPDADQDSEPFFGFWEFGESNIDFWVYVQAKDRNGSFALKSDLIKAIHERFTNEGIEINYPVRKMIPSEINSLPQPPDMTS